MTERCEPGQTPAARRSARPVPGRRLPAALFSARLAARSAPRGASTIGERPHTGSIEEIAACKRALLVTYRRDGTPVPTPVWAALGEGGRLYVRTERSAGKLKRLRNDARLLVAPCTVRGKPLGAALEATARMLAPEQEPVAERALARRFGFGRELFERTMDALRVDMCFIEITPGAWEPGGREPDRRRPDRSDADASG
ncbi:MAG TPA: PPOX class F420-dependent oxidoreductase [Solirubrobacteraceae bacterium]|nr:PPOX class F420-dependent oxidoreductase [Solirubrobacteraceae bacterium]